MGWFNTVMSNKLVQIVLVLIVVFALLKFLGFQFDLSIGQAGISAGVTR